MNVVFDLGGVLLRWRPDEIIASVFDDPSTRALVRKAVFDHPDWLALDRGTLEVAEAIDRAVQRTGLARAPIVALMEQVPRSLTPQPESIDLVRYTREKGNRLYVLSNMQAPSMAHLERTYAIWDLFEGLVISCRIQLLKPEPEIYQHLLDTHALQPEDTVFIDDMERNVEGARQMGIRGIRFESAGQCELELRQLGCL